MDNSTLAGLRDGLAADLSALLPDLVDATDGDLATAERQVHHGMSAIGTRPLTGGLALRGTVKDGPRLPCACGACSASSARCCRLPRQRGRWRTRPGCKPRPAPCASLTETVGGQREAELGAAVAATWADGLALSPAPAPARLYVAMDGVRILDTRGMGKGAKVGVVVAEELHADGTWQRAPAQYVASFAPAAAFGQRLARAAEVVVLGDGAEWIWQLAAEHCLTATRIVDWDHARERIWALGRVCFGEGTAQTRRWVGRQLCQLANGQVRSLVTAWRRLPWTGAAAVVRDERITYFTKQAARMAHDRYRARRLDIGSEMVESACKHLIGAREKGRACAGAPVAPKRWPTCGSCSSTKNGLRMSWPPDPDDSCPDLWLGGARCRRLHGGLLCGR